MVNQPAQQKPRVVVGVDGSPGSETALRWALAYALRQDTSVEAVSAWQYPDMYGYSWGYLPSSPDGGNFSASAEKALEETVARVQAETGSHSEVATRVIEGHPAQVLMAAARGAHLLVVGTRGHGTFAGVLLGSVSQHCVQHAPCPVVVVPQEAAGDVAAAG
jgi:nucleotide-binding universal stress UspA family protein